MNNDGIHRKFHILSLDGGGTRIGMNAGFSEIVHREVLPKRPATAVYSRHVC